ncbi:hypothetical protein Pmar_PMAR020061 [Perkinsus marinus ATCC 50983]|uniref:Uncharacterized protein n=1 Tax=Perkinsus marinus (strain ATCC 50983 / TXsc) TaxID=423536 RepID=C5KWK7_PERM5|nr:hypothetical protein Pmar_PMAR020061 [Perkinsus marinus ATCC 50983]EER11082.1 hypothetical protein Pmar_PMAR020061 [Perkinsus marinus ATCC 50983]|eukprot:XP_002779287.1 hypothetical protein Pmar_PMAR020061 [Perkinsus marinus ATCC 50983]
MATNVRGRSMPVAGKNVFKVQDFVLGHLSMAGQVPMEAFYITKYQNRAGEIVMSMEIRPTNAGSSTEMVRRLATALEDPKSKLHRPGSLSSKVFTAARMDVRNPGEVQREWASPVSSRAYSPTGNIGSPGKSGSSPTMARSLSPERVVAQARPIGVMKAAVTASQKILSRPVVKVEEEPVSEVAVRGRPAVVSRKVVRESTRKAKSGRGPAAPTESKRKGSEEVVSVSRNSTIKPMRKVSDAVLKVMEPLERKKDTGAKQESAFMAKWRETILNATKKSEPAGSYVVSVLPGQPGVPTRELERHTSQDMSSSLLEARRGLKLDGEAPESPGSLSAASAARNLETEGDAQVVSLDRALWDPLLHGKKARFDGYVLRSVELSGDGAQSWAVSEVKPYVDGDRLVWKCEIAGLLPADKLADAAETMGPGFGVCGRTTREVNAAIDTPEAAIVGYDLVSVAVAGRFGDSSGREDHWGVVDLC